MDRIRRKLEAVKETDVEQVVVTQQVLDNHGLTGITLRPYQLTGVKWLVERFHRNHGCILGDEMGLGKTCQTISLLVQLYGSGDSTGPYLILSPLSVMGNWKDELQRFAPGLDVVTYTGDKERREELRRAINNSDNWNVLLTTYEMWLKDASFLQKFSWSVLVVDEAHRLKNQNSLLHQTLIQFDIQHRVLLTGTPVQNNLRELYALLSFIAPRIFRPSICEEFVEEYEDVTDNTVKNDLHVILLPFLLRRTKSEVVLDLPKKSEVLLYHGLSALQKKLYKAVLTKDIDAFEQAGSSSFYGGPSKTRLMNVLMQLRKVVNHPYLFDGVEPEPFELGEHLVEASGKLHLLDQLLSFLYQNGHKVLLFSQMTHMLDIIQDYLGYRGYSYERLDGSVRGEERFLAIRNFNEQDETFVFLLSTKAGGQGLNLTSADTVIFVDSDFNPQNDLQAAARAHRIGQTRPVKIIRLVGRDSVEELILRKADAKLKLTNSVIEGGQFSLGGASSLAENATQLSDMIKFGLDKLLQSDESSVVDVDLKGILGGSLKGEWLLEEQKSSEEKPEEKGETMEEEEEEEAEEETHMYMFEGKDYSKETSTHDNKAFDELVAAEIASKETAIAGPRSRRKNRETIVLPELPTRKRKELTDEEKEERKKKRQEAAAKRAKLQEEAEVRRAQEKRKRMEALWAKNSYESANVTMDTDDEDDDEEEMGLLGLTDDEEGGSRSCAIQYVRGDVTHPQAAGDEDAIVVHCVDDSGSWGQGGIFTALAKRSDVPEEHYELAGRMKDLALGDAHIIPIDDKESRDKGSDKVALIVAQHRDRHNNLSGIKLSALSQGLQRVYKDAKNCTGSVHLPRIGYATPGFNWYGTERLIRKYLAAKGIPTYVYYFPRKHHRQGAGTSKTSPHSPTRNTNYSNNTRDSPSPNNAIDSPSPEEQIGTGKPPRQQRNSKFKSLPEFLHGVTAVFQDVGAKEVKELQRYVVAYNGDVEDSISDDITHVILGKDSKLQSEELSDNIKVVSSDWLWQCIKQQKRVSEEPYQIT